MNMRIVLAYRFVIIIFLLLHAFTMQAQRSKNDTIQVGAYIIGKDTMPHLWLNEVYIKAQAPKWLVKQRREWQRNQDEYARLRYNVYLVYPYAVAASLILKDVDSVLASLYSKEAKQQFKQRKEDELNRKFKHELEDLTITQGQILIKLIARQTGKPCYQIVKELKGGFNAGIWQAVALLFNNNLRNTYDAQGDDAAIESVVLEIESSGHFEMKY